MKSTSGFPVPGAALPVLAAALVIVAGIGVPTRGWDIVLTNPVSRYVGRISYSLYLIHWPVIVLVGSLMVTESWLRYPITVLSIMVWSDPLSPVAACWSCPFWPSALGGSKE